MKLRRRNAKMLIRNRFSPLSFHDIDKIIEDAIAAQYRDGVSHHKINHLKKMAAARLRQLCNIF